LVFISIEDMFSHLVAAYKKSLIFKNSIGIKNIWYVS